MSFPVFVSGIKVPLSFAFPLFSLSSVILLLVSICTMASGEKLRRIKLTAFKLFLLYLGFTAVRGGYHRITGGELFSAYPFLYVLLVFPFIYVLLSDSIFSTSSELLRVGFIFSLIRDVFVVFFSKSFSFLFFDPYMSFIFAFLMYRSGGAVARNLVKLRRIYRSLMSVELSRREVFRETFDFLNEALSARFSFFKNSAKTVGEFAVAIAREMGLPQEKQRELYEAARVFDIGYIGVSDRIAMNITSSVEVCRSGGEDEECLETLEEFKMHVFYGWKILMASPEMEKYLPYAYYHHERYDGKGYPEGIPSWKLPLEIRILTVANAVESMFSGRWGRKPKGLAEIKRELLANAGTQFDPEVVDVAVRLIG